MMDKPIYLCANCARELREPLKLREANKQSAEKGECLFCKRKCYGALYLAEKTPRKAGKEKSNV